MIVVGLGGMGSAVAAELAARGVRVLGLERYEPAHAFGSSHGQSRVIRQTYFEGSAYVPLVLRAYERWRELERLTGADLMQETGGLMIGPASSPTVTGSLASAQHWGIDHEVLDAREIGRRWPVLTPGRDDVAVFEPHAGFVRPEATVAAQLRLAESRGAELHFREQVEAWEGTPGGVEVRTGSARYRCDQLVLAAGAWAPQLLAGAGIPFTVERHVQFWLKPRVPIDRFAPQSLPVFIWEGPGGDQLYGVPATAGADCAKTAFYRAGTPADPDHLRRTVDPEEAEPLLSFLADRVPDLGPEICAAVPCMYTATPDRHFVLGFVPGETRVVICSPCSGHGFKFAPVIGEVVADLVERGHSDADLSLFDPVRFTPTSR